MIKECDNSLPVLYNHNPVFSVSVFLVCIFSYGNNPKYLSFISQVQELTKQWASRWKEIHNILRVGNLHTIINTPLHFPFKDEFQEMVHCKKKNT